MRIKLELDEQTTGRLVEIALAEKRPLAWQAEILLQQAIARWCTPALRDHLSVQDSVGLDVVGATCESSEG